MKDEGSDKFFPSISELGPWSGEILTKGRPTVIFIASKLNFPFVTNCVGLKIENNIAYLIREIDGGRENIKCNLPIVIGSQKGLVEESDLKIPNMRGIMQASKKEIKVLSSSRYVLNSKIIRFEKPSEKKEIKMISPENLDELIDILHNKVKVIWYVCIGIYWNRK